MHQLVSHIPRVSANTQNCLCAQNCVCRKPGYETIYQLATSSVFHTEGVAMKAYCQNSISGRLHVFSRKCRGEGGHASRPEESPPFSQNTVCEVVIPLSPSQPAGQGVAMVLVPAMHSGDSRVFLWSRSNVSAPLHVFTGHTEAILEVQWRQYRGGT